MTKITPKFSIGQKVQDKSGEIGVIQGYSFNVTDGFRYQMTSKEVDIPNKKIINGIKNLTEDELEAVKEKTK